MTSSSVVRLSWGHGGTSLQGAVTSGTLPPLSRRAPAAGPTTHTARILGSPGGATGPVVPASMGQEDLTPHTPHPRE